MYEGIDVFSSILTNLLRFDIVSFLLLAFFFNFSWSGVILHSRVVRFCRWINSSVFFGSFCLWGFFFLMVIEVSFFFYTIR